MLKNAIQSLFDCLFHSRALFRCPRRGPQSPIQSLFRSICLTLALTASGNLFSHAVVTESSLRAQPVKPETPTSVVLNFNSEIELTLSQVFLVSTGDVHQKVTLREGRQPGQIIIELPPLSRGEYALRYKVFAADGHLTEDVIHFSVSEPEGR